jgi:hypothetical protein
MGRVSVLAFVEVSAYTYLCIVFFRRKCNFSRAGECLLLREGSRYIIKIHKKYKAP